MSKELQVLSVSAPGFNGLNKTQESSVLTPEWATKADNLVIDAAGQLAERKGFTITPASNPVTQGYHDILVDPPASLSDTMYTNPVGSSNFLDMIIVVELLGMARVIGGKTSGLGAGGSGIVTYGMYINRLNNDLVAEGSVGTVSLVGGNIRITSATKSLFRRLMYMP